MNPLSPATKNDIVSILEQEQEHALSLLSLSPLLASLFVTYASRAGARGPSSSMISADSEEWKHLQGSIALLREENETLKSEAREMIRKLEISEASQEMLRSQVSSLNETNSAYQKDIGSLRAELIEARGMQDRVVAHSEAEKTSLKVKISDLEIQRGQLRDTAVKQQIRISRLGRPIIDGTLPLRLSNTHSFRADSDSTPSPPLQDSPIIPIHSSLPSASSSTVSGRLSCMSPTPGTMRSVRPHPMARGGLVPGRHKSSTDDMRAESVMSCWFADGD